MNYDKTVTSVSEVSEDETTACHKPVNIDLNKTSRNDEVNNPEITACHKPVNVDLNKTSRNDEVNSPETTACHKPINVDLNKASRKCEVNSPETTACHKPVNVDLNKTSRNGEVSSPGPVSVGDVHASMKINTNSLVDQSAAVENDWDGGMEDINVKRTNVFFGDATNAGERPHTKKYSILKVRTECQGPLPVLKVAIDANSNSTKFPTGCTSFSKVKDIINRMKAGGPSAGHSRCDVLSTAAVSINDDCNVNIDFNINAEQQYTSGSSISNQSEPTFFQSNRIRSLRDKFPDNFTMLFLGINFVFLSLGVTMFVVGAIVTFDSSEHKTLLNFDSSGDLKSQSMGIVQIGMLTMMVCGFFVSLVSIFGAVGTLRKDTRILYIYCLIIILLLITKIIIIGFAIYFRENLSDKITEPLKKALEENYDGDLNSLNSISRAFDYAQVFFGCCGVTSYTNFQSTKWFRTRKDKTQNADNAFPLTCCRMKDKAKFLKTPTTFNLTAGLADPKCLKRVASRDNEFTGRPCQEKVKQLLMQQAATLYYIGLSVVCLELLCVTFAKSMIGDITALKQQT